MGRMDELRELIEEQTTLMAITTPAGVRRIAAVELRAHGYEDQAMTLLDEAIRWYESQPSEKLDSLRGSYALTLNIARRWDKAKIIYEELAQGVSQGLGSRLGLRERPWHHSGTSR